MRVAWLPDPDAPDELARDLLELTSDIELRPCSNVDDLVQALAHDDIDVVLVPTSLHPAALTGVVDAASCTMAYGVGCSLDTEEVWLDAGADGVVDTGDPERLLRALYRSFRLRERARSAKLDPITALPTRSALLGRFEGPPPEQTRRALMLVDVIAFASINDTFGTEVGDQVLATIGQRLQHHFNTSAWLARTGGDEFAAVLQPAPDDLGLRRIANDIARVVGQEICLDQVRITPRVRVGFAGSHHAPGSELLRDAAARIRNKSQNSQGSNRSEESFQRSPLGNDFDRALSGGEFTLHYQPIVAFDTGKVLGFEALARWNHRDRGLIPPDEFVPLAEHNGFIVELGSWVLHEACQQLKSWQDSIPELAGCSMNVNLSPRQLLEPKLIHTVAAALEYSKLDSECLRLELTENRALTNVTAEVARMHALRALGVQIHIDDFGSGFAQLGYLARLPVDVLKIDRSLVSGLQASRRKRHIVCGVVDLAERLEIGLVAEGVETLAELRCLEEAGITVGQGYLFSAPVAADRVPAFAGRSLRSTAQV